MTDTAIRLHAAVSLDGFCADAGGGVGWLDGFTPAEGADAFQVMADTLVMGRATYDQILGLAATGTNWPYPGKRCYVLTGRPLDTAPPPGVQPISSACALIARLRERGGPVWLVGGAKTVATFLDADAVAEIELFIVPVLLGRGLPLLPAAGRHRLTLLEQEAYRDGMVRVLYAVTPAD